VQLVAYYADWAIYFLGACKENILVDKKNQQKSDCSHSFLGKIAANLGG
jgi:hypothetical protein